MKKNASVEEKAVAVAKSIIKDYKESGKKGPIYVSGCFETVHSNSGTDTRFASGKTKISFGDVSNIEFGRITELVGNEICKKLKLKKSEILNKETSEHRYGSWYSSHTYTVLKSISIVRPCKGFFSINKKLVALGLKPINFKDWYYDYVSGKRSSIFEHDVHYYAESEKMCEKVLAYLKGKKKLSYNFFNDDNLDDRERGIEFETEWDGSISRKIQFIDSKGKTTKIY